MGEGADHFTDSGSNTLYLHGIGFGELQLSLGSFMLTDGTPGDEIHLDNFDPDNVAAGAGIDTFIFDDGTTLTYEDLIARGFTIEGTADADVLTGTSARDTITAFGGGDVVIAKAGDDIADAGEGDDILFGGNVSTPIHQLAGDPPWERTFGYKSTEIVWMKPARVSQNSPAQLPDLGTGSGLDAIPGAVAAAAN